MRIKYLFASLIGLAMSISMMAQKTNMGIDYMVLGENELAKEYFMKVMRQKPVDSYYYLGEIALQEGKLEEAKKNYQSGLNSNSESALNAIGLAKLGFKADPKATEKEFNNIKKQNKKDIPVLIAIAKAYIENGEADKAEKILKEADKAEKNSPLVYIFRGQMLEKDGKVGEAATMFDQALNFDEQCVLAYVKGAQVYSSINPTIAIDKLKKATEVDANYTIAYKYLADLNYSNGFYPAAIESYKKLFESGVYTGEELTGYSASLFFSGQFDEAEKAIKEGLGREPKNFVLNRLMMYTDNELKKFEEGKDVADVFFSIPRDTAKYILQDHMTYANILTELGDKQAAIDQYKKALELDPSKVDLYQEVAIICANGGLYEQAGDFYKTYVEKVGEKAEATDYYQIGNYYYRAAAFAMKDSATKETALALFDKADIEFTVVTERMPDVPLGYLMRARVNAAKDPETTEGLAKPHYEALLEVISKEAEGAESPEDRKTETIEAYAYLSYYYYLQFADKQSAENKTRAKECCEKLLELDPEHPVGTQLMPVYQ